MGFKKTLIEALKNQLNEEELKLLPRGFQTLEDVIIIKLEEKLQAKKIIIGNAYLDLMPHIRSVYLNTGKITGIFRTPEVQLLVGEDNPIIEHKEHGVTYRFDMTKIMFSMGNLNERKYLSSLVKEGELIVDMFAGIGYFSLPIAKHCPKVGKIYSIELNPVAFRFLVQNIKKNHFEEIIEPVNGDSKEEVLKLNERGIKADRVIMGVFPAPIDFIENALQLTKQEGTIFHYEGVRGQDDSPTLFNEFRNIAESRGFKCNLIAKRFVKSYGPRLFHIVVDILVERN